MEVSPPNEPRVTAGSFIEGHVKLVAFQHRNCRAGCLEEKIILPCAEPQEFDVLFEIGTVENGIVFLLP